MKKKLGAYGNKELINKIYTVVEVHNSLCAKHERFDLEIIREQIENSNDELLVTIYYFYCNELKKVENELYMNRREVEYSD